MNHNTLLVLQNRQMATLLARKPSIPVSAEYIPIKFSSRFGAVIGIYVFSRDLDLKQ